MFPYYILDKKTGEIKTVSMFEWSAWFEDVENRRIEVTEEDDFRVSTVFIGIDHSYGIGDQALLYETCVLEGPPTVQGKLYRYATMSEAKAGHWAIVGLLRGTSADFESLGEPSIMNLVTDILDSLAKEEVEND
jgi:hypothetical protein